MVRQFFGELSSVLPRDVTITVPSTVEVLDSTTGQLTEYVEDPTELTPMVAGGPVVYAGPSGAVINWLTNSVVNGRRLRGRTFIVPLNTNAYEGNGTLTSSALSDLNAAASVLSGAGFSSGFGILSRPAGGGPISFGEVVGHRVPDMASVLRSRRD